MTMKKQKKIQKSYLNKVYVFQAVISDVKKLKKNKDLSKTFKNNALMSLKRRADLLFRQITNDTSHLIAIWERTVA